MTDEAWGCVFTMAVYTVVGVGMYLLARFILGYVASFVELDRLEVIVLSLLVTYGALRAIGQFLEKD